MIGFSASFAKTIKLLLEDLKNQEKIYEYVFSSIIANIEFGELFLTINKNNSDKVINVLCCNGFDVKILDTTYDTELQITW